MRIKFLSNMPLQGKFLALILVSMLVPLILVGGCLYYLIFTLVAEQLGVPESIAYNLLPVIKRINLILLIVTPPMLLLVLLWGAFLSHKFAGPLVRLRSEIERIVENGDYTKRLKVRKGDSIKPITDALNDLLDRVQNIKVRDEDR
jgi:signal transduction histidine kinase